MTTSSPTSKREEVPCYVARCLCGCGRLVFASVDEPGQSDERKRETAKEVADLIRKGYAVERMSVAEVRAADWFCEKRRAAT